ncbi:MAG: metallophosphoesterase [Lachnospiraceae bacterium]
MRKKKNTLKIQIGFLMLTVLLIGGLALGQWLRREGTREENKAGSVTGKEEETEAEEKEETTIAPQEEVHLMVATDLHYISSELTDHGYYFTAMIESADGKTMEYCEEVVDVFIITALQKKPDALILTGDLTFNGAKKSHEDLAAKLTVLEEAGIPVLVLSGNHDLNSRNAAKFVGESYERVEGITEEEFASLYGAFGMDEAASRDTSSGSYLWECTPGLRLLLLDVNGSVEYNSVSEETLRWIETELQRAKEDGAKVIAFSHQNLLRHSIFTDGYIIKNAGQVLRLYQKYGVVANFGGHLHIQHIEEQDGVTEIVTSALQIAPTQYGNIMWNGLTLEYQTESVDVSVWAKNQGLTSKNLCNFEEYAKKFFYQTAYWQAYETLIYCLEDETLLEPLIHYYMEQNYAYFSGRLDLIAQEETLLEEWKKLGVRTSVYLESIAREERVSRNHVVIEAK